MRQTNQILQSIACLLQPPCNTQQQHLESMPAGEAGAIQSNKNPPTGEQQSQIRTYRLKQGSQKAPPSGAMASAVGRLSMAQARGRRQTWGARRAPQIRGVDSGQGQRAGRSDRGEPGRGGTLCRRSKVISSRRRDQIADGAASATMAWVLGRSPEVAVVVAQLRAAAESDPAAIGQG